MATFKLVKKSALAGKAKPFAKVSAAPANFLIVDNEDSTVTVTGADAAGFPVDISAVATLTPAPASDNTASVTVDPPSGMTVLMHAIAPGAANVSFTATWTDGSVGPFSATLPVTVTAGPAGSLVINPGPPVPRP